MVSTAPVFSEIREALLDWLSDAVLCAHNVRFDYGFLKNEFKRIGISFQKKLLCTVKLSRKLYPQHQSHSLDAIIERFNLMCEQRHRAMGDTETMAAFIHAAIQELGESAVQDTAQLLLKQQAIPAGLDYLEIHAIPDTCGVYLFYGESALLYVGKSISLRARVLSHFQSDHRSAREMRITQEVKRIEYQITSGELGALLLESQLIKSHQPIHNRQLRREKQLCAWRVSDDPKRWPLVTLINEDDMNMDMENVFGTFRTKRQALQLLNKLADEHGLCDKALGLEKGSGVCFSRQLKRCRGVCDGSEPAEIHHVRLLTALNHYKILSWPFKGRIGVKEYNPYNLKAEVHVFNQWCYLGSAQNDQELDEISVNPQFDRDTYRYLLKFLNRKNVNVIQLD